MMKALDRIEVPRCPLAGKGHPSSHIADLSLSLHLLPSSRHRGEVHSDLTSHLSQGNRETSSARLSSRKTRNKQASHIRIVRGIRIIVYRESCQPILQNTIMTRSERIYNERAIHSSCDSSLLSGSTYLLHPLH